MTGKKTFPVLVLLAGIALFAGAADSRPARAPGPAIQAIFDKPMYKGATWGLRVVKGAEVLMDVKPGHQFYIGSVRKCFSVGQLMDRVGPGHTYDTPIYRTGRVDGAGVLHGNLVLVASGDLTMGGRRLPNGRMEYTGFDHNEADSLGNAVLTKADPLAGYRALARQVAAAGIKRVKGEVVIDDRLFKPFNFRGQFDVRPIFVNDDCVDLTVKPTAPGKPASVVSRPRSAALTIDSTLATGPASSESTFKLDPELPTCIGQPGCKATVSGSIPADLKPPLTNRLPLVQTVRITQPSSYARTVLVEALKAQGVAVDAPLVEENPVQLLPAARSYRAASRVALLRGMKYGEDARLVLKVSYNIGADTSLVLFGLTQGANDMPGALKAEQKNLSAKFGIAPDQYHFIDGSGGGNTTASNRAVTTILDAWATRPFFALFRDALPSLGVDGSLGFVTDFQKDATLRGARGRVHAKTGTYAEGSDKGMLLKGQALAGYITTRSGKHLVFHLVVNNVPVTGIPDLMQVFQDQGRIAAILWRDY